MLGRTSCNTLLLSPLKNPITNKIQQKMDKIKVFVIDPPWAKKKGGLRNSRKSQGRELDYPTMNVKDIFNLLKQDIFPLADNNHCIFMWTIDQFLCECEYEMSKCGYRRHCRFVWNNLS